MDFSKQCLADRIERSGIGNTQPVDEARLYTHPFQHSADLQSPAVDHHAWFSDGPRNGSGRILRFFQQCSTDLDYYAHLCSPSPVLSPSIRLRFWTACPAAPFTRLSITDTNTVVSPRLATPIWQLFVRTTLWIAGIASGNTRTKSEPP